MQLNYLVFIIFNYIEIFISTIEITIFFPSIEAF